MLLIERERQKRISDAVDRLDEPARSVVRMRYFDLELLSQQAVADRLGLTRDEIRGLEKSARAALKRSLAKTDSSGNVVQR